MSVSVESLDHTADAGFRITADSLDLLLTTCAKEMVRLSCPEGPIRRAVARPVRATGDDLTELLINWLSEIHGLMAVQYEVYGAFHIKNIRIDDEHPPDGSARCELAGIVEGEPLDPARHRIALEIKGVTFGDAYVRRQENQWECQVIFDL